VPSGGTCGEHHDRTSAGLGVTPGGRPDGEGEGEGEGMGVGEDDGLGVGVDDGDGAGVGEGDGIGGCGGIDGGGGRHVPSMRQFGYRHAESARMTHNRTAFLFALPPPPAVVANIASTISAARIRSFFHGIFTVAASSRPERPRRLCLSTEPEQTSNTSLSAPPGPPSAPTRPRYLPLPPLRR